jgi:serine/threonine-protein kinase
MTDRQIVQSQLRTAAADAMPVVTPMPGDLVAETVRRLRVACIVWAILWITAIVVNHLVVPLLRLTSGEVIPWSPVADWLAVMCVLVSGLVYRFAPIACTQPNSLVNLGLAYEVVLAFAIGVITQWQPHVVGGQLSWICALVLLHPTIVPGPPRKILLGSLLAASMDPVGLAIARLRGVALPPIEAIVWAYLANYVCAVLAVVPSHVLARMSRQVRRAREMGSYRLGDLIGEGGMGEVWQAHHRLLARPAAIKLIRPERTFDETSTVSRLTVQRFRREAQAAASLRSPHTIQLYDFGVTADGRFYLVMELLDGIDLESLVRRFGPQPPSRVIHLLRQACHSLAEAHGRGLVHRDIKPANIHLCRLGLEYDFVKVLDFGLVKHDLASSRDETLLSAPGMAPGTPAYMAPEMATGDSLDGRLDLYSLGCVAYFLLTGEMVFDVDNALAMISRHLQTEPIPPSIRSGRPIPRALEDIVLACLAKNPGDRPSGAAELSQRLAAIELTAWTQEDARAWWDANLGPPRAAPKPELTDSWPTRVEVGLGQTESL